MVSEIRTVTVSVSASSSAIVSVSFEKDLNVIGIQATERAGTSLSNVHFTIDIDGQYLIRPSMPVSQLGSMYYQSMPLKFSVKKGSTLKFSVTNNLTSAVTIDFALLIE